jgi:ribosomal protein L12E/L44/L45/RPP1/RPP2
MAKETSDSAPISDDSIGYLEEVKKGKSRKFAMICKGTSVISLVVYKKGNVEKHKKEAKQTGKGQFYFGIVDGKGQDIRFVLARADGFESPPVKSTSLKGFLEESTELKWKPYFEVVDAAPLSLDEDDPLVARFLSMRDAALRACDAFPDRAKEINSLCLQIGNELDREQVETATSKMVELESLLRGLSGAPPAAPPSASSATPPVAPPAPPTSNDAEQESRLVEALKLLKPRIEQALTQHPNSKAELVASITKVRDEIKNKRFSQAQTDIVALGELLKSLMAASSTASPTSTSTAPGQDQVAAAALKWKESVAAWTPTIKTAIAAKGPNAAELLRLLSQASALSKPGGDLTQALAKLTECYQLANPGTLPNENPVETEAPEDLQTRWTEALSAIEPQYLQGLKNRPDDATKLRAVMNFAHSKAEKSDYKAAIDALKKLNEVLTKRSPSTGGTASQPTEGQPADGQVAPPQQTTAQPIQQAFLAAMTEYQNTRQQAIDRLREIAAEIAAEQHPDSDKGQIEVRAVMAQLTQEPASEQQVVNLQRYLLQDDVVFDVCELSYDFRTPLLQTLNALKAVLPT